MSECPSLNATPERSAICPSRGSFLDNANTLSAAGKSHLAMSLSLSSQIPSLSTLPGGAIILTSERELSTDRLVQLAKSLLATHQPDALAPGGGGVKSLLDNVHTNRCGDVEALDHALSYMVPHMLRTRNGEGGGLMGWNCGHEGDEKSAGVDDETLVEPDSAAGPSTAASRPASSAGYSRSIANPAKPEVKPIRLIILDSITALFRGGDTPFSSTSAGLAQRSKYLCSIADKLKALAVEFNIAILVINQVSDVFSRAPAPTSTPTSAKPSTPAPVPLTQYQASQPSSSYDQHQFYAEGPEPPMLYATQARWFSGQTDVLAKEASLGIVWANCVNVRVMLSRTGRRRRVEKEKLSLPSGTKRPRKGYDPASVGVMSRAERETEELSYGVEVDDDDKPALIRRFHLVFSPFAPPATIDYIITSTGLHTLEGSSKPIDQASALKRNEKKDARKRAMAEDDGSDAELEGGVGDATQLSDGLREGIRAEEQDQERRASFDSEFGGEVFDDLGDLPAEFWEGRFGEGDGVEGDEELVAE